MDREQARLAADEGRADLELLFTSLRAAAHRASKFPG
jgi:hypothetical protein